MTCTKVPIILQALALLFDDDTRSLRDTYTATFEQLVGLIYLKKIQDTELSEEDIEAAMEETNKLAFESWMKDRVVFPTDSIANEHIFRLGILSVTKTETPYGKLSLAHFHHTTLQEYAAGGHVGTEYKKGNTDPWKRVKMEFTELFTSTVDNSKRQKRKRNQTTPFPDPTEHQTKALFSATVKFIEAIMRSPEASIKKMAKVVLDKGVYADDPDLPTLRESTEKSRRNNRFHR